MSKKDRKFQETGRVRQMVRRIVLPLVSVILLIVFLRWLLSPAGAVGESVPIQGRDHIKVGESHPPYNSNPPTSGPHYENPVSAGVYESEYPDEALIHSLEHGYVIVSYNCGVRESGMMNQESRVGFLSLVNSSVSGGSIALAHGDENTATPSFEASSAASTQDDDCHQLVDSLRALAEKLRLWKLIVVPRSQNDTRLALTAWGRIDKFGALEPKRIERFVKLYRDQGPEKTKD